PRNTTRSSRRISCAIPRATASRYVTVTILPPSRALRWLREACPRRRDTADAAFGPAPAASLDHRQHRPDRDRFVRGHLDLQRPAGRGRDVGVHLVGADLQQRLALGYLVTLGLVPDVDRALVHRLAHPGHHYLSAHLVCLPRGRFAGFGRPVL